MLIIKQPLHHTIISHDLQQGDYESVTDERAVYPLLSTPVSHACAQKEGEPDSTGLEKMLLTTVLLCVGVTTAADRGGGGREQPSPLSVLLVASPYAGHVIPQLALGEELIRRGHSVTLVSGATKLIQRETERLNITLWGIGEDFITTEEVRERFGRGGALDAMTTILDMMTDFQQRVLKTIDNSAVESYDIMVVDGLFSTFSLCFSHKWEIPTVNLWPALLLSPFDMHAWTHPLYSTDFGDNLSFFKRLVSSVIPPLTRVVLMQLLPRYFSFLDQICANVNISFYQSLYRADYLPQIIVSSIGFEFPVFYYH